MNRRASRLRPAPFALALLLGGCEADHEADAPEPVRPVLTAPVSVETSRPIGPFAGVIEPRYTTEVGFQTAGRVVARDVDVGDVVKQGERVAALDPTQQRFRFAAGEASLASALAQLNKAQAEATRQRWLLTTGATTQANVDVAVANLGTAQATLDQAKAALSQAKIELGYTTLAANYDAVITARSAEVGQVVVAGQPIVTLARPDVREAVFDVPDSAVDDIPTNVAFSISLLADPSVQTTGKVREIAPAADSATRTRRIRLSLPDPPSGFRLGSTVEVTLHEPSQPQLVVPAAAVSDEAGATAVWIADPKSGKVRKVPIKQVDRFDDSAVVAGDLAQGDRVVIAGVHSLADGESVKVESSP
ncbi:MAG: efflux RND transporter periplasmic adaptor subunit [Hyphomicrobiales bacterium]|nr:efflux RND transporter periplasmic adaptor subunit [Hyphomicrobiales bacterium]